MCWLHGRRNGGASTTAASGTLSQLSFPVGGMAATPPTIRNDDDPPSWPLSLSLSKATPPRATSRDERLDILACGLLTSEPLPKDFCLHESYAMVASVLTSPWPLSLRRSSARRCYPQHAAHHGCWCRQRIRSTKSG